MHIGYTSELGSSQKTAGWLSDKATARKTKFEPDQKNRLEELWCGGDAPANAYWLYL